MRWWLDERVRGDASGESSAQVAFVEQSSNNYSRWEREKDLYAANPADDAL